jgi:hypothetical protein
MYLDSQFTAGALRVSNRGTRQKNDETNPLSLSLCSRRCGRVLSRLRTISLENVLKALQIA